MLSHDENRGRTGRLLSIPEVADFCGLSSRSINRAILDGDLRAAKLRSRWRIRPDDLDTWVKSSERIAPVAGRPVGLRPTHGQRSAHSMRRALDEERSG